MIDAKVRHFLRDDDLTTQQRIEILDLALQLRNDRFLLKPLNGPKTVVLIFDKPSTRTRVSFSVGVAELGGIPLVLDSATTQMSRNEPIADTARVLSRQAELIVWRTFSQSNLEQMGTYSDVPVVNALSDLFHPCQVLADLLTIRDEFGQLEGLTVAFLGDLSNNIAHSYLLACAEMGINLRLAGPTGVMPHLSVLQTAYVAAERSGSKIEIVANAKEAAYGAQVITTDTWTSMGSQALSTSLQEEYSNFQVSKALMDVADQEAIFLHCLPAYRGKEVAGPVIDGPQSRVWAQAENRLHVQKSLMARLLA